MYGSEYYSYIETLDGYVVDWVEDDTRLGWYYSDLDSDGRFYPTHILVKYPAPAYLDIPRQLREIFLKVREFGHHNLHSSISHSAYLDRSTLFSTIKPLVFLVDFNNLPSDMDERKYSKDQFQHLLFDTNLDSDDANLPHPRYDMSVRDYYDEISNAQLEISGDSLSIIDWAIADHDYSYYVDGKQGTGWALGDVDYTKSAAALVVERALAIKESLDFSRFDGNQDGDVDVVILIVEGWANGDDDQFWPQMSTIPSTIISNDDNDFNGVAIKKYIVIPEQIFFQRGDYYKKGYIHPIGTICHEFGHILGLPDLYDTNNEGIPGIGEWGLMGSGNYRIETSPAYMSAWSRYRLGFIEPDILENVSNWEISIPPAEGIDIGAAYILPMDSNMPQEYLILENRQKMGSDEYLKQSGLLVWHIDETITGRYPALRGVNIKPDFYGVNLLQADGLGHLYTNTGSADVNDPFPGNLGVDFLTHINTYSYDRDADGSIESGGNSGIEITEIVEGLDSLITLTVRNPNTQGQIYSFDNGFKGNAFSNESSLLQWAGIRIIVQDTALLSGVKTVFPASIWDWNVTDYTLNIWSGWSNNKPEKLLCSMDGNVQWTTEEYRDGGWAYISLIDKKIIWNAGESYYVEIKYNGSGYIYFFDPELYSENDIDNMSYYRGNIEQNCIRLSTQTEGNWNIRAVMSGLDNVESLSMDIHQIPKEHRIYSNYPNPFNPISTLPIYLVAPSNVSYYVFDIQGRQITERDFPLLNIGYHEFDINMNHVSSGVYFYQFTINEMDYTPRKMVLLK